VTEAPRETPAADAGGERISVAVSSCLLGQEVRYDGGHKHNSYITQTLGRYFDFVAYCPEVAIGLGVPRPPIKLVQEQDGVRVRGVRDPSLDVTDELRQYGKKVAGELDAVCGYLFKKGSPSCGIERVKIYRPQGEPIGQGAGMYARTIMECLPELPVEEEGRLMDPGLRENFVERVFVYNRWKNLLRSGIDAAALVDFHTRHKFIVLAHDEPVYRELGRLVADAGSADLGATAQLYICRLMRALAKIATRGRHANVLMHIAGYFKRHLDASDRAELLEIIEEYRLGRLPLVVPVTLLKHHLRRYPEPYIGHQYYLNPHPRELMLRNHI
jgi:uncharacterized protein YbgA (DUF1722 family)/uncharacterized protein YbbK (DUF523 family)